MVRRLLLAAAATFAASPALAATFEGHTYEYVSAVATFAEANAAAAAAGGYLVTVTSQAEQDFVFSLTGGAVVWAGGSDAANEGTWVWLGGPEAGKSFYSASGAATDLSYSYWNYGEPNDYQGREDALALNWNGATGQWNDYNADNTLGYVIEFGTSAVPEPSVWAMLTLGFGLVGAVMRRRPRTRVTYA